MVISLSGELGGRNPTSGGSGVPPWPPTQKPPTTNSLGGSAGPATSTGGLQGNSQAFLIPYQDAKRGLTYFMVVDPTNFNCEEDASYYFKQEETEERIVTIHKVLIKYRDFGNVTFTVGVSGYTIIDDKYISKEVIVKIVGKRDGLLHTTKVDLVINVNNPQLYITRKANSGPLAIAKAMMVGTYDEDQQV